jgi:hypothetical protein
VCDGASRQRWRWKGALATRSPLGGSRAIRHTNLLYLFITLSFESFFYYATFYKNVI